MVFSWSNICLLAMAVLEFGQAAVEFYQGHHPKAVVMLCAGVSSIMFTLIE